MNFPEKLTERLKRMLWNLLPDERDVIVFGGLAAACYGIAELSAPAAWIVGGAALFWLGVRNG